LIYDILIIKHSSKISAWMFLFSLACWLVGFWFLNDAKQIHVKILLWHKIPNRKNGGKPVAILN
jgi:hypothetical protein